MCGGGGHGSSLCLQASGVCISAVELNPNFVFMAGFIPSVEWMAREGADTLHLRCLKGRSALSVMRTC